ncbi:MAG: VWA domain-containing protein, partial [Candidatus Saccharimonas sp.]|nr:VWA domain-containing protein [Planctomycetaceae bacterium]
VFRELKDPAPRVSENVPVAAVFLFDTSSSMAYKQSNQTRLQAAQQFAKDQLGRLPGGSKVAVAASGESATAAFSVDLKAAQTRIEAQEIKATGLPLNDRLRAVLLGQEDDRRRVTAEQSSLPEEKRADRFVREVYLFTDLAKSAWREESSSLLKDELERLKWIGVYIIDVGTLEPINVALHSIKLSRESVPAGGSIRIDAVVSSVGKIKPDQTVELHVRDDDGPLKKADQQSVLLETGTEARVTFFPVESGTGRFRQGELRLTGSDPLSVDDVVHFTVQTIPPLKVLVVAEQRVVAQYWLQALKTLAETKSTDYRTEFITTDRLGEKDLTSFDVVCIINASSPSDTTWTKLRTFVEAGGGLAVFLGANSSAAAEARRRGLIDPVSYNGEAALGVLPARLNASLFHRPAKTMDLRNSRHVLLQRLDDLGVLVDLGTTEVRRYWKVDPLADAVTIARYGDSSGPVALVERRLGQGRVVMLTTGVDGIEWNDLLDQNAGPLYIVLADQLVQYLSRQASGTFNHLVGDEVSLPLDRERKLRKVVVRMPDFKQRPQDVPAEAKLLTLRDLSAVGSYAVDSPEKDFDYRAGFSMNLPAAESDFTRFEPTDLDRVLGEGRYSVSRDPSSLERNVLTGRLGQEMYSLVVAFLVAIFALEQFTATWFYRTDES